MSAPTEKGFSDLLTNYFASLNPLARDVTLKNDMRKVAQPDGSTKITMVPTKGDAYLPKVVSSVYAKAIAKAVFEQVFTYVRSPVVEKINELVGEYNRLRADFVSGGGSTTSQSVDEIS